MLFVGKGKMSIDGDEHRNSMQVYEPLTLGARANVVCTQRVRHLHFLSSKPFRRIVVSLPSRAIYGTWYALVRAVSLQGRYLIPRVWRPHREGLFRLSNYKHGPVRSSQFVILLLEPVYGCRKDGGTGMVHTSYWLPCEAPSKQGPGARAIYVHNGCPPRVYRIISPSD